jgi:hypothetical protein
MNFGAPVLVIGFNRPDLLSQVLSDENLLTRKVFISIDGPRNSKEATIVDECVALANAFKSSHPKTFVRTSERNLGCKLGVRAAIDWVFLSESEAIILEDDVVPTDFFYTFMDEMLESNRDNHNIWQVSGHCALPEYLESSKIYLSEFPQIWGWATWKSRWQKYDHDLDSWDGALPNYPIRNLLVNRSIPLAEYWIQRLNECKAGFDTWDYQWVYSMWANSALAISPGLNLCANQGFDERATHTKSSDHKQRDRSVSSAAHLDLTQIPEFDSQLDEVVSYVSYGVGLSKTNVHYNRIQKMARIERLRRLFISRSPSYIFKKVFWSLWNSLQIYSILNALGVWGFLARAKKLFIKPRH